LIDEQIKSGAHVRFQGHEGVVERLYLQSFSLRRYDKGLAFFPNGILLENSVEIVAKTLDKRCLLSIHLDHSTPSIEIRMLIQKLDNMLWKEMEKKTANERSRNAVGLLTKLKHRVDMFGIYERARLRIIDDEMQHRRQFWVTISNAYVIEVVFYTSERHKKERSAELTNVSLALGLQI
jgi:small-conductance mechanosensitive channel